MQMILCFVVMFTFSVANGGKVYVYNNFDDYNHRDTRIVQTPKLLFLFEYHGGEMLNMKIYLNNKPKNVNTYVYRKYAPGDNTQKKKLPTCSPIGRNNCEIKQHLNATEIFIELELYSTSDRCTIKQNIIKGKRVSPSTVRTNNTPYNDMCLLSFPCVIVVDLRNTSNCENAVAVVSTAQPFVPPKTASKETTTNKTIESDDKSSELQTWIYVMSSVIVMCLLILTIYISAKTYYRRNSHPVETMELNTYATVNEVVYADLSLAHGDSQPPRREESPYAQIIGVMKPVDGNAKKK